jgi:uncharacterized membrane protein YphA (DoxX/SURF4 family)
LLRLSLAVIFVWFGALKLAGLCPLADFVCRSLSPIPPSALLPVLGVWETTIGICLLVPRLVPLALLMLLCHLPGTALPLVLLPGECFTRFPFGLSVEGQYIVKNLTLVSAVLVLIGRQVRPSVSKGVAA